MEEFITLLLNLDKYFPLLKQWKVNTIGYFYIKVSLIKKGGFKLRCDIESD